MDKNSSRYTILYASVMVIVVAVLLSVAAISLAPFQAKNVRLEKMQQILLSIGVYSEPSKAAALYRKYIKEEIVLDKNGTVVKDGAIAAFDIDLKKEQDKAKAGAGDKQLFPLFILEKDGKTNYIIPVRGKGLWGPIWGYIALAADMNTLSGASFGHKSETPGLGAEIETPAFQDQFVGKKIMDEAGKFVSVKVVKGGVPPDSEHAVDAVSGGTITSNGVTEMLQRTLANYIPYFKSAGNKENMAQASIDN